MPIGSEHLYTVIRTREGMDNLARDEFAVDIATMARFHGMREQRFNFDDLPLPGCAGDTHAWFCHTYSFSRPRLLRRRRQASPGCSLPPTALSRRSSPPRRGRSGSGPGEYEC